MWRFAAVAMAAAAAVTATMAAACGGNSDERSPRDRRAIAAVAEQAHSAYDAKHWSACADLFRQADDIYDAACCDAQAGDRDRAFAELTEMLAGDPRPQLLGGLATDDDLAPLHGDPRWATVAAAVSAKLAAFDLRDNRELRELYTVDQSDRAGGFDTIDWSKVTPRDRAREKRVDEILAANEVRSGADFFNAAMVWQHGEGPPAFAHAHALALAAVMLDPTNETARWLAAASEDRLLVNEHKPQRWGTQYMMTGGVWILNEVDPSTTDDERAVWNVPTLAVAQQRARDMNAPH